MHSYTRLIGTNDNINASQGWQYGGCMYASLYRNFSHSNQFHGKNNLEEIFSSLRGANNPRITVIVNRFEQNAEAPQILNDFSPKADFTTNDQYPMSISVYDIQGILPVQKIEDLARSSPEKATYNLHIVETRVER